jgi:hypothetical protein
LVVSSYHANAEFMNLVQFLAFFLLTSGGLRLPSVKYKSIMNNTSETEQYWDLIITPRKKWLGSAALPALPSLLLAKGEG